SFIVALVVLAIAAPWSRIAVWCWIALVGLYSVCNVSASFLPAARSDWTLFPLLPLVFACCHFAYGYGFWHGVWTFCILRRPPTHTYTKLTRTPERNLAEKMK